MRIGYVSKEFPPFFGVGVGGGGGVSTYVYQVSRAMAAAGHEVHVFTTRTGPLDESHNPPGVEVHRLPYTFPNPGRTGLVVDWASANECYQTARLFLEELLTFTGSASLDLVEFPENGAPAWLTLLDDRWTVPSVVNCHTPYWIARFYADRPPQHAEILEVLQLETADAVVSPSAALARRIAQEVARPEPIEILRHPFQVKDLGEAFAPPAGKTMLFVGRLELRKGVVDLIDAAANVLIRDPAAELVLVAADTDGAPGGGSLRAYLAARLPAAVRDRVTFAGHAPTEMLGAYYRRAAFCVFPSLFDNFPNVCLEAMAAGRACIVGDDSGMVEIVGDTGLAVPPRSPEKLATAMRLLLDNPERCRRLSRAAYERVRARFSAEKVAGERGAFYERLVNRCGGFSDPQKRRGRVQPATWARALRETASAARLLHANAGLTEEDRPAHHLARRWGGRDLPVVVFGAGRHTEKLLQRRDELAAARLHVVGVVDEDPGRQGGTCGGFPIGAPVTELLPEGARVIVSSDAMEPRLFERAAHIYGTANVGRLYYHDRPDGVGR